ncbi:NAD-dependent succinate-semialdehyde dehydrogenase [Altererythrobacter sp. SALINAS58]|uniref:NAD-dependent succinate-semialdehyde dehydrogenase n=1 Tax=Alteripontixanthobacter muriae TaxID=2705546 RepID=UPI0015752F26|nr:NAD-dependent succinate-semialdehyde dehydrogenase [Alteripontixanthobacter muriae]NTZ43312.1 NAD-dependent succinate-semialdehyde dehydrogenase [Alteripontixanthobacter muriae]
MDKQHKTINPATGEIIATYDLMDQDTVFAAVEDCHVAFRKWRNTSLDERAENLRAIGKELRDRKDEFAALMTREMGKTLKQAVQEVQLCAAICDWTADNGPEKLKDETRELQQGVRGVVTFQPIGVIYGIQPWNFPAYQVVRYSIASLMAGNGVMLKHAENVTGSGEMLRDIYEAAGLPKNLFTVIRTTNDISEKVIQHELVRGVTFTGSETTGRVIAQQAAQALKKTVLELGSNDAYVVLEDADLDQAVKACVTGRIYNNGETCVAAKRFVVVDKLYDQFRDAFVERMKGVKMGDPTAEDTGLGPMAREDLRDKLAEQVEESVKNGATVLCGGEVPEREGYYYPATVLEDVKPGQPAYDDELFGPVAALIRARDDEDAMRIANDSRFGLGGGIFSKDVDKAVRMAAEQFDTGMVFINGFGLAVPNMPFGGVKHSGYGREHGGFGMHEFVNIKGISVMAE